MPRFRPLFFLLCAWVATTAPAAEAPRPLIWVRPAERAAILHKIETQPWARSAFAAMQDRVREALARHQADPVAFLREIPLVPNPARPQGEPMFAPIIRAYTGEQPVAGTLIQYKASLAIDCGVLYFLTGDEAYARCAADILNVLVGGLLPLNPQPKNPMGGLLYPKDLLYEARVLGAQIPIIYDLVHPYLRTGAAVRHLGAGEPGPFDFVRAQSLFRLYAQLVINQGLIDNNHPVLEMPCLAHNILALDDPAERSALLAHLLTTNTPRQDSLTKVIDVQIRAGGVWPEPFGYSAAVSSFVTYLIALVHRQDPALISTERTREIALGLARLAELRYPNGDSLRIGDSPRRIREGYWAYEIAHALGQSSGDRDLQATFGGLLSLGLTAGHYDRSANRDYRVGSSPYFEPLKLLWFAPEIAGQLAAPPLRTTDALPYAGLVLQRNLSPDHDPQHALMAVVNGAHHVHAHASGMALELYGAGTVLGSNAGSGTYQTDEHENYRRLFAAYNTVIVNGASRSDGGWSNLGINPVELIALEPAVGAAPVSPRHSFSITRFVDDKGEAAEAVQERLVGLVRTSYRGGFYVDVFRSRSALTPQFHDYVYHNLGDTLQLATASGPLPTHPQPDRFVPARGTTWQQNRTYLFPGWHFFKAARVSAPTDDDVTAEFTATALAPAPVRMKIYLPGSADRDYATAQAPATKEAPAGYAEKPTPVLVVRQTGEAWTRPFAAIYEPRSGETDGDGIQSVTSLAAEGVFAGFKIVSRAQGESVTHYVLVQPTAESTYEDAALGISFRGRYGVITLNAAGRCASLYLGEGRRLRFGDHVLNAVDAATASASAEINGPAPAVIANTPAELTLPDGRRVASRPPQSTAP